MILGVVSKAILRKLLRHEENIDGPEDLPLLSPLTPTVHDDHEDYIGWLDWAIKQTDPNIYNIALSGGYGSGKSSILKGFAKDKEVIWISFGTLGESKDTTQENTIQKEIVKQLIFKEKPSTVPHSNYQRVRRPSIMKSLLLSLPITIFVLLTFYGLFNNSIAAILTSLSGFLLPTWIFIGVVTFSCISLGCWYLSGKINIEKLGGGSIPLSFAKNASFFDEYIDEIIYFFEATKYRIVIFEDIDRFNNPLIFEQLRQLNILLNNSAQVDKKIQFIYAVKDSLFAGEKDSSANRTKFFDLIIPIVPFITHENAPGHLIREFPDISHEVIKLVAQHITDMRQILNISNEYKIFRTKIFANDNPLNLDPDKLFALVVYKNCYMKDFEDLKNTNSDLDAIYLGHRDHIRLDIENIEMKIASDNKELVGDQSIEEKVKEYAGKLEVAVEDLKRQTVGTFKGISLSNGEAFGAERFAELSFWKNIEKADDEDGALKIEWTLSHVERGYGTRIEIPFSQTISKKSLEKYIGEEVLLSQYSQEVKERIHFQISEHRKLQQTIKHSTIKEHIDLPSSFKSDVVEKILANKPLAYDLVYGGYIDDFYLYYYSTYNSTLTPEALRFKHINIYGNIMDVNYRLKNEDIEEIISDVDRAYYSDASMYNIDLVEYLVKHKGDLLKLVVDSLSLGGANADTFIASYISSRKPGVLNFIKQLSRNYPQIFETLTIQPSIDVAYKNKLINTALSSASMDITYSLDKMTSQYIASRLSSFAVVSSSKVTDKSEIANAMSVVQKTNVKISLKPLNELSRQYAERKSIYSINRKNLNILLRGKENFALDKIHADASLTDVYIYLLKNIDLYIETIKSTPGANTLKGIDGFEKVINNVALNGSGKFADFMSKADSTNCIVEDINLLDKDVWSIVMQDQHVLIQSSLDNLLAYYEYSNDEEGKINSAIVQYLNEVQGEIHLDLPYEQYDETLRNNFLRNVMNNRDVENEAKTNLVKSLYLDRNVRINIKFFDLQEGDLYGRLLAQKVLADSAESYGHIQGLSWKTKEAYLKESSNFAKYVGELEIGEEDWNNIAQNADLAQDIRQLALDRYVNNSVDFNNESAQKLAEFSLRNGQSLSAVTVEKFAQAKVPMYIMLPLINLMDESATKEEVQNVFKHVTASEYAKIARPHYRPLLPNDESTNTLVRRLIKVGIVKNEGRVLDMGRRITIV